MMPMSIVLNVVQISTCVVETNTSEHTPIATKHNTYTGIIQPILISTHVVETNTGEHTHQSQQNITSTQA